MNVRYLIIAILVVASLAFIIPQGVYSEAKTFTIKTDKEVYFIGETIHTCGTVPVFQDMPVAIQVFNPRNIMYTIGQPMPDTDGTYSFDFKIGGKYGLSGTYTVKATYHGSSTQTTFTFEGETTYDKTKVYFGQFPFEAKIFLTNGNVQSTQINANHTSLILLVHTCETEGGELRITLPRALIDARTNGHDTSFMALRDGEETKINETATTPYERTLTIPVPARTGKIEIVGTNVIPEFPVNLIVLATSIAGLIIVGRLVQENLCSRRCLR